MRLGDSGLGNGGGLRPKVLVVDDEPNIRELLATALKFAGFAVTTAEDGQQAISQVIAETPEIIILDVMMPVLNGFEVTSKLRDRGIDIPIIFLTAKDSSEDKVRGLNLGADDYLAKPFSLEELIARVQALLRRSGLRHDDVAVIRVGDLELDESLHEVRRAGVEIELTPTEFQLLRYLMLNAGQVVSKMQILEYVWQNDWSDNANIVESYISYLRRKVDNVVIADDGGNATKLPPMIHTKRGVGYLLKRGSAMSEGGFDSAQPPKFRFQLARVPLRWQLVVAMVLTLATGLVLASTATYALLANFLVAEIDARLARAVTDTAGQGQFGLPMLNVFGPTDFYTQITQVGGQPQSWIWQPTIDMYGTPAIPPSNLLPTDDGGTQLSEPFTVSAVGGNSPTPWRVVQGVYQAQTFMIVDGTLAGTTVNMVPIEVSLALPLSGVQEAQTALAQILWAVGIGAVILGAIAAWLLVRRLLNPLEEIEATAADIAAGDLSHRVAVEYPATEIGSLGMSLNAMLNQIEQAFTQLTNSENRMRQFISDASHELRTPLATIRGYSELYRMGAINSPDDLSDTFSRIETSSQRMSSLITELLDLARLDEVKTLELAPVDLVPLAKDAAQDLHALDPTRQVQVFTPDNPVMVNANADKLAQVFANLVGNVATHTPPGTPCEISIETESNFAIVQIRDHGPGVTAEQATRLFERFYRLDAARGRDTGGAGLGLAIVQSIITAHHGQIKAQTPPSSGLLIQIELPLIPEPS